MLKHFALVTLLVSNFSFAAQLSSYQEAVDAINQGKTIKVVADWDLCKTNVPFVKPEFSSSYAFENPNIAKSGFIQSWGTRYTHVVKAFPQLGPVHESYVYKITNENKLTVINRLLDPITYKEKMPAFEATCELSNGFTIFVD